jgi:hypothetical protein
MNRNNRIKELESELEITKTRLSKDLDETRRELKEHQELLGHGQTYENLKAKLEIFNDFSNKLRKLLLAEEKRRGLFYLFIYKSYYFILNIIFIFK